MSQPKERAKIAMDMEGFKLVCLSDDEFTDGQVEFLSNTLVLESEDDIIEFCAILHKYRPALEKKFTERLLHKTYVERELLPLGFRLVEKMEKRVVLSIGHLQLIFDCTCPTHTPIKPGFGCPIHHEGSGGPQSVNEARKIAEIFKST